MIILSVDFEDARVLELLRFHVSEARGNSPPGTSYALDLSGLRAPEISFWAAWEGETLLGFGALKELDARTGEIKSMRTHPDHLRKGVAARLLDHLVAVARSRGYRRVSLETGSGPVYEPALALYRRHGFVPGEVFGEYRESDFNQYLHLELG